LGDNKSCGRIVSCLDVVKKKRPIPDYISKPNQTQKKGILAVSPVTVVSVLFIYFETSLRLFSRSPSSLVDKQDNAGVI